MYARSVRPFDDAKILWAVTEDGALGGKPVGTLNSAIWQLPFRELEEVINEVNRYSTLGAPKLMGKRVTMASALGYRAWHSSSLTFSSLVSSTASPASSSPLAISKARSTATPQALPRKCKLGGRRRAGRSGAKRRLSAPWARACARPSRWSSGLARCRSGSLRRPRPRRCRGQPLARACNLRP